jgi:hypothetical protein
LQARLSGLPLTEPEVLNRSIILEYKRLQDDKRRSESEFLAEFERMKPLLLGDIMDILVKALQIKPNMNLQSYLVWQILLSGLLDASTHWSILFYRSCK